MWANTSVRRHTPVPRNHSTSDHYLSEKERSEATLKGYTLPEEERLALNAKYGPPNAPLGSHHSMILPPKKKKKGGDAA